MCRRFLWLATLATIHFGFMLLARADTTNAAIPYKTMDELCQIASGADQAKLKVEVYVSSANKAVQSSNIMLMIQSATQGRFP
jgi:DNA polymerase III sliding clamp (beta) subunit (PCNA family)